MARFHLLFITSSDPIASFGTCCGEKGIFCCEYEIIVEWRLAVNQTGIPDWGLLSKTLDKVK